MQRKFTINVKEIGDKNPSNTIKFLKKLFLYIALQFM